MQPTVLVKPADELGTDTATRFAHAFVEMWPMRRRRIQEAICVQDSGATMDAVLSLRSGSLMAGAGSLAGHTDLICAMLLVRGLPAWEDSGDLLAVLNDLGERTVTMLCGILDSWAQCRGNQNRSHRHGAGRSKR